jgi:flagellar biosynthetic protein FliR
MDLNFLATGTVLTFMLIITRISGLMMSAPIFTTRGIPMQTKVGFAICVAMILFPIQAYDLAYHVPQDLPQFIWLAATEFSIGLMLGFACSLIISGIQLAGEFVAIQMGLSLSSALDPISGITMPTMGQIYYYLALLVFLNLNVHHALLLALGKSFAFIPLGTMIPNINHIAERFLALGSEMFILAVLVALPVMGVLFVTEIATALVAKVMPQMNVFMVFLPAKSTIGLLVLMVSLPLTSQVLGDHYADLIQQMMTLFR